jgi:predicted nucleotidyltransferase
MSNHIDQILLALTDAQVEFVVGGGVAAVLHGVERVTLDVDLALDMEPANVEKFLRVMQELRLQPRVPVPVRDLMSSEAVQRMITEKGALVFSFVDFDRPLRHVDIFLRSDLSFEELSGSAHVVSIKGRGIKIIGIEKLLEIKRTILPLRDKDLIDIKQLEKLQGSREKPQT